jgi:hypothetical protein
MLVLLSGLVLSGCTLPRVSRYDEFEKVKVDKMAGNDVNLHVLSKTIVCLNGMRETRWPDPATNITIRYTTNFTTTSVTNMTVTSTENQQFSSNTNSLPPVPVLTLVDEADPGTRHSTNAPSAAAINLSETATSGLSISTTTNESLATSPNQSVLSRTTQTVTMLNSQGTVNAGTQSIIGGTNRLITVETNYVISTVTNQVVTPTTNVVVTSAALPVYDYFLYTEIAPADFQLASGESLVLLIDGERHSFAPSQPTSMHQTRRDFQTTFYRVPAEVLVGIGNAKEVKLRIRSATGGIDRKLNSFCRQRFRHFLEVQSMDSGPAEESSLTASTSSEN